MFLVVCFNGLQGLKMHWNVDQHQDTGHTATREVQDWLRSNNESAEEGGFSGSLWLDMHDHVGKISTRSWLVRLDLFWLYD